jgi:Domain of unknown function (DUF4157)
MRPALEVPAPRPRAAARSGLTVSHPGDTGEREADRVADRVLRMPEPARRGGPRRVPARATEPVPTGAGRPLPLGVRAFFEPRFGHDLGNVRVHADDRAARSARALHAAAYTVGRDVVFAPGQYRPDAEPGRRLLAHELAHVVQQRTGRPCVQRRVQVLDDPLPPGVLGPPARTGAAFIEGALEQLTDLDLSYAGDFLQVTPAVRAAVRQERRQRPTAAEVRAAEFIIPGVARQKASAALRLAQIIISTEATARIQPVFGQADILFGAYPAGGGGGIQEIDIEDIQSWQTMTDPSLEPARAVIRFLRSVIGRTATAPPAVPIRTDTVGTILYHEIVESFEGARRGAGTAFPGPHRTANETANIALRSMENLEVLQCPSFLGAAGPGGEVPIRTFWRRRTGPAREDRFEQVFFLSAPPAQTLVWVEPPTRIQANVPRTDPCPP